MRTTTPPSDLEPLRLAIVRRIAAVMRAAGLSEHEVGCRLEGDPSDLRVVLHGAQLAASVMQAIRVRVLDAVRADGRTFGRVEVDFGLTSDGCDLRP
jgi:hypothetical protein